MESKNQDALAEFPYLRAGLEDAETAQRFITSNVLKRRHLVCLMFDSLEFIFYEILLLNEIDIYKSGQNTIVFDEALEKCRNLPVDIPLIGTIRKIQKLRGDAKHHAQTPDDDSYNLSSRNFPIVISRLVYEQFEATLV